MRLDWLSTFVLFVGTLVFGVNLLDSFLRGLSVQQVNRLVWTPRHDRVRAVPGLQATSRSPRSATGPCPACARAASAGGSWP
ncbi:hypothetical protein GCM10020254_69660 [Streptomyces goshikiensis]